MRQQPASPTLRLHPGTGATRAGRGQGGAHTTKQSLGRRPRSPLPADRQHTRPRFRATAPSATTTPTNTTITTTDRRAKAPEYPHALTECSGLNEEVSALADRTWSSAQVRDHCGADRAGVRRKVLENLVDTAPLSEQGEQLSKLRDQEAANIVKLLNHLTDQAFEPAGEAGATEVEEERAKRRTSRWRSRRTSRPERHSRAWPSTCPTCSQEISTPPARNGGKAN